MNKGKDFQSFKFRHLQGLRAVAVVLVIAFHFGLPVRGGFLGVDLFFLISGFIIPFILIREYETNGKINLKEFYLRRIHRLLPASIFVIFFTSLISALILSPEISLLSIKTSVASLFALANFFLADQTKNYFSPAAELNPFLHYWSLAVEEQVYILVAVFLGLIQAARKRIHIKDIKLVLLIVSITLISLSLWFAPHLFSQNENIFLSYFSTLNRIWEFTFGFLILLAYRKFGYRNLKYENLVSTVVLFVVGYFLFITAGNDSGKNTNTFLFLLASCYFLYPTNRNSAVFNLILSSKPLQYIGDRSYSLYLVHWPVVVFLKSIGIYGHRLTFYAFLLTFIFAVISYRLIETPLRKIDPRRTKAILFLFTTVSIFSVSLTYSESKSLHVHQANLNLNQKFEGEIGHDAFFDYLYENMFPCTPKDIRQEATNEGYLRCWQSIDDSNQKIALLGDSHSEHLFPGFAEAFPNFNVVYFDLLGSPTSVSTQANRILDHVVASKDIEYVVISAYWKVRGIDEFKLRKIVQKITGSGKTVFLTTDVPDFITDPFNCKYGVVATSFGIDPCVSRSSLQTQIFNKNLNSLSKVSKSLPNVQIINTTQPFCGPKLRTCRMTQTNQILYRDPHHLNVLGSKYVINYLRRSNELSAIK